jgi:transketolase
VSKPFYEALVKHGASDSRVTVVTNDLTASCEADGFRDAFPERYVSAGMAEQALISALSGMAHEGLYPIFTSFAVFCTRRPYEQVALTLAYPAKKVTLVGFLPGLTTPGGVTHQAVDDIGLMTGLPNMTVVEAAVPRLFTEPLELGSHRVVRDGSEVIVLVSGHLTGTALAVVDELRAQHPEIGLRNVATLKPFDDESLLSALAEARAVITVENHWLASGLGALVSRILTERRSRAELSCVGITDTFTHGGSARYLEDFYGISAAHIRRTILQAIGAETTEESSLSAGGQVGLTKGVAEGL